MKTLTQKYLHEVLRYEPATGVFTWRVSPAAGVREGSVAGSLNRINGYLELRICRNLYRAQRLAWFYVHGFWPQKEIDIINGGRSDIRICNLREASRAEVIRNRVTPKNNTSGVKGVSWHKKAGKWRAQCTVNRQQHHLGLFTEIAEAEQAVKAFREKHHGKFANHGKTGWHNA